jgi:DNA-directed RNA polymerase subunit F
MSKLSVQVDSILGKIGHILDNQMQLEQKYMQALEAQKQLSQQIAAQDETIKDLQEQVKHLKLTKTVSLDESDQSELKATINEMIKEIDRCMSMLNI